MLKSIFTIVFLMLSDIAMCQAPPVIWGGDYGKTISNKGINNLAGTEAEPSYIFADDFDTGLYWVGADSLAVSANGINVIKFEEGNIDMAGSTLSSGAVIFLHYGVGADSFYMGEFAGNPTASGDRNTVSGDTAGNDLTTGPDNAFYGSMSAQRVTTGQNNSAFGSEAMGEAGTDADYNSCLGYSCLANVDGNFNAGFGAFAGDSLQLGDRNVFFGYTTDPTTSTTLRSVAVGFGTRAGPDSATAIGHEALASATESIAIGSRANATAIDSVAIGTNVVADQISTIVLGDIHDVGVQNNDPQVAFHIGNSGQVSGAQMRYENSSGSVTIGPANATDTYELTLPPDNGGAGECMTTDGAGVLTWGSCNGGTFADGTAALPSITFASEPTTGGYLPAPGELGLSASGAVRLTLSASDITTTEPILGPDGSDSVPTYAFSGDPDTGIMAPGVGSIGITTAGTRRFTVSTTQVSNTLPIRNQDGTDGAPAYSFSGDTDTGILAPGVGSIGFATAGTRRMSISTTQVAIQAPMNLNNTGGNVPYSCTRRTASDTDGDVDVACSANEIVVGGGCDALANTIDATFPPNTTSWRCLASASGNINAYAICCLE